MSAVNVKSLSLRIVSNGLQRCIALKTAGSFESSHVASPLAKTQETVVGCPSNAKEGVRFSNLVKSDLNCLANCYISWLMDFPTTSTMMRHNSVILCSCYSKTRNRICDTDILEQIV